VHIAYSYDLVSKINFYYFLFLQALKQLTQQRKRVRNSPPAHSSTQLFSALLTAQSSFALSFTSAAPLVDVSWWLLGGRERKHDFPKLKQLGIVILRCRWMSRVFKQVMETRDVRL